MLMAQVFSSGPMTLRLKSERRTVRFALPELVIVLPGLSERIQSSTVNVVPAKRSSGPVAVWPPPGEWQARLARQYCSDDAVAVVKLISPQRFAALAQVLDTSARERAE